MLPTFVIGLREGLEAALIVGIIAAFVSRQGRRELLRWVHAGVAAAVLLCLAVGIVLQIVSAQLPQREQEGLETVVGAAAVGMVTYMVVWMRRHSRELKGQLEGAAAEAMAADGGARAGRAMVLMAFLAVLREGFETVVFLLAAFHESGNAADSVGGAVAGIAVAVLLGYGIYRGGVKLNLSKFFRATGIVLVLVAAGLVATALHTAHEAGWLNAGQGSTVDLSGLVRPGTVRSALLTGMLGVQGHPVLVEVVGWLAYLVPVGLYVGWPPNRQPARRTLLRVATGVAGAGLALVVISLATLPAAPKADAALGSAPPSARLVGPPAATADLRLDFGTGPTTVEARQTGTEGHGGITAATYTATVPAQASGQPAELTWDQAAALNGGRLPLGVRPSTQAAGGAADATVHVSYAASKAVTVWVEPRTGRIVDMRWTTTTRATLTGTAVGDVALDRPVATADDAVASFEAEAATDAARRDLSALDRRSSQTAGVWIGGAAALVGAVYVLCLSLVGRPRSGGPVTRITAEPAVASSE